MLKTLQAERTEKGKALSVSGTGNGAAQSLESDGLVYCEEHGLVNGWHGQCEECVDEGYRDWDATRVAKSLIPAWVGIKTDGRTVIVAPVKDALEAVQTISRYKNSDALVLIAWDGLITALDNGRIGPSWTLQSCSAETLDVEEVECARCCQPFTPVDDEQLCEQCWLAEYGPPHR
jgi:hypothetical protein